MGVAMNHVAAVTMPLVGGILWKYLGFKWTFLIGSAAAAASYLRSHPRFPRASAPNRGIACNRHSSPGW